MRGIELKFRFTAPKWAEIGRWGLQGLILRAKGLPSRPLGRAENFQIGLKISRF